MRLHVQEVGAADEQSQRNDDQAVTGPLSGRVAIRNIRIAAWLIIVALAAFQAYAQRYTVGPDGISYLDLSDAVVRGRWPDLVSLYWSPLYPFLIGLTRRIVGDGAAIEVPIAHAVNFVAMVGLLAAFEYFLFPVLVFARRASSVALGGRFGLIVAYALFAFTALTMTTLELTTPDVLAATSVLLALGALVRLNEASAAHSTRDALVLGVALGFGALAKSFMVPWAIVCVATLAFAFRRRLRVVGIVVLAWGVFVIPWCAVQTAKAGRFTFGDAGRLTWAWFVNEQSPPALGGVPPDARTLASDALLPGSGIVGDALGTDPMWFDPSRWNASVHPHWSVRQELETLEIFPVFFLQQLLPLLILVFLIAIAPRGSRRVIWRRGWIVYVPAFAGLLGYAMVLVTSRYIMPFVLATTLLLLATAPIARRISALLVALAIAFLVVLEALHIKIGAPRGVVAAVFGGIIVGAVVLAKSRPTLTSAREGQGDAFAARFTLRADVATVLILIAAFGVRFAHRLADDATAFRRAQSLDWGNVSLRIARDLASHGVSPGTRIAVIGPHAESYWARAGRLKIVANVPRPLIEAYWGLPPAQQDSLLALFAKAGATYAIASMPPSLAAPPDARWTPVRFSGWMRRIDGR